MSLAMVVIFIAGSTLGTIFGMVILALGIIAKRNVSDMPEVPIVTPNRRIYSAADA